jgi:alpha-beta hydrolase superfamily lysophospholipase
VVAALADDCQGPVVLMGLSVGGMTAALAAQAARGVQGVIATTLLDMSDPATFVRAAKWRWLGMASLLGFRWMPSIVDRLRLPLRLVAPMDRMSSHPAMTEYFQNDPLLGGLRVPSRFFRTMHTLDVPRLEPGCPVLLVHPGADGWTPTAMSRPAFDRVLGAKRLRELSNGSHLPVEMPARVELEREVTEFLAAVERNDRAGPG